jgi:integrase
VAELAVKWLRDIEATRPNCRKTSLWHGALAASRAIRPLGTMPVSQFGSKALLEVQRHLVETPIVRRKPKRGRPEVDASPKYRSRRYVNDVVARVRQMFHWGVLRELVPDDRVKALEVVPALVLGASKAKETKRRKPVKPSLVKATLPHLPKEVADLVWFMRLTGCRPSEAARMKLSRIRDRDKPVWRYVPRRHKTAHHGKTRHIPIGPQAQEIVLRHTAGREPTEYVFTPQRSVPPRKLKTDKPLEPTKTSPLVGRRFKSAAIRRAITRAIERAELPHWTPYQLRYTRLREIRKQEGREAAQAVAGHSTAMMTDHYAPANWGRAAKAAMRSG